MGEQHSSSHVAVGIGNWLPQPFRFTLLCRFHSPPTINATPMRSGGMRMRSASPVKSGTRLLQPAAFMAQPKPLGSDHSTRVPANMNNPTRNRTIDPVA